MLGALVGSIAMANLEDDPRRACKDAAEEQAAAAQQYVANLKALVAARVVPGLQRGILKTATSRPGALTVEVTDDPSPYRVTARVDADGSWTVRLSLGYTTLHDAALDAAGLAAALHRPQALRRYLAYQQDLARQNAVHRALGEATERARSFAEFIGLSSRTAETVFARREWKRERDRAQTESLGWVVAYLLTREDPRLAGMSSSAGRDGEAAARLAAASGWRPVPPFATAFGLAAIEQPTKGEHALLCHAARLMEAGIVATRTDAEWRARVEQDKRLQGQRVEIEAQIRRMRRDGGCATMVVTAVGR